MASPWNRPSYKRCARSVERQEDHLDDPGAAGEGEAGGVVHDDERLRAALVARVPNGVVHGYAGAEQTRTRLGDGREARGQAHRLVEAGDVRSRREVDVAVGVEGEVVGFGEHAVVVGAAKPPRAPEDGDRLEGEVNPVRLELRLQVRDAGDQRVRAVQHAPDLLGREHTHGVTSMGGDKRKLSVDAGVARTITPFVIPAKAGIQGAPECRRGRWQEEPPPSTRRTPPK